MISCRATFTLDGELVDPTTVRFKLYTPVGGTTTMTYGADSFPVRESEGVYRTDLNGTLAGTYTYRWETEGGMQDAIERQFAIRTTSF